MRQTKFFTALLLFAAAQLATAANVPEWVRALHRTPVAASYPDSPGMAILHDEQITNVAENGEIRTLYRRACRILNTTGRGDCSAVAYFDTDTKILSLRGWTITKEGVEYEVKEKDAIETQVSDVSLYDSTKLRVLRMPADDPGATVAFEYEQRRRPTFGILQDIWSFQEAVPVLKTRMTLNLPPGWEVDTAWINYPETKSLSNYVWEFQNVPAVKREPGMPTWRAVAGKMAMRILPTSQQLRSQVHYTWADIGKWYTQLTAGRRTATPEIAARTQQLVSGKNSSLEKMRALTNFLQREIRYVSVAIGIGGYQPNAAPYVFTNRFGDCKDKATLLSSMLKEIGIESYYVVVNNQRGVVLPEYATMAAFNHVILAIRLPEDAAKAELAAAMDHPKLGKLLFFDPTDQFTPLGLLPLSLQDNYGLLVTDGDGELVKMPLQPAVANQLVRMANLTLSPAGTLAGEVREIRRGQSAAERRWRMLSMSPDERKKFLQEFLGVFLPTVSLENYQIENLEDYDKELVIKYKFSSYNYAKRAGNLLLVRPRIFGQKGEDYFETPERKYPVELDGPILHRDEFEIALPAGFVIDEMPEKTEVKSGSSWYSSSSEAKGTALRYVREYGLGDTMVPPAKQAEFKKFYRLVAADERSSVVLKPAGQ